LAEPIRVIAIGAHPDDCEYRMGATAALLVDAGHAVKFVSVTNGDAGHHKIRGPELAARRYAETREVARRLGVDYDVLDHHDGQLMPTLEIRHEIIRLIRDWRADLVLGPRPNDYHPDHRYTSLLVQDAAFLVTVPALVPDAAALRDNPVFLYFEDGFQRPNPFRPDIAIIVDEAIDRKIASLDAHVSQFYEWLPWLEGNEAETPVEPAARFEWLKRTRTAAIPPSYRETLSQWYGAEPGARARYCEAFEICEYGSRPDEARIRQLFPMLNIA
jgi:LmbE family N-acetylglucosaminyl deacetylase